VRNVVVTVWRDNYHVAVMSVTDEEFLAELQCWAAMQKTYHLVFVDKQNGLEHQ
jgi:hypothetical protein